MRGNTLDVLANGRYFSVAGLLEDEQEEITSCQPHQAD
jgi:hypothetical protein